MGLRTRASWHDRLVGTRLRHAAMTIRLANDPILEEELGGVVAGPR